MVNGVNDEGDGTTDDDGDNGDGATDDDVDEDGDGNGVTDDDGEGDCMTDYDDDDDDDDDNGDDGDDSNDGAETLGHRQRLPSEEEEGRASHPPGNEVRTKGGSQQTEEGRLQRGLTTTKGLAGYGGGRRQEGG
jgi:hypothetical protein